VHRLNFVGDGLVKQFDNYRNFTLVDTLNGLKVICSTEEARLIVYENFEFFFKSIIFYGVEVEKILCLNCLVKFCETEFIRNDLFNDEKLIEYLSKVKNDQHKVKNSFNTKRLDIMIENFLAFKKILI
jgi:hypothetical protein